MFRRLLIEDWTAIFTIAAFVTVASIYLTMLYRTVRLRRPEIDHLSNLPFDEDQPVADSNPATSRHE